MPSAPPSGPAPPSTAWSPPSAAGDGAAGAGDGGRAHQTHNVTRWTLGQVQVLIRAYKPRKPEYRAAVARLAALCTA